MATISKRVNAEGATSYQVKVRIKGNPLQTATFNRLTDAKKWAAQIEAAIRERRHFKSVEAQKHTLNDMVERYIRDVLPDKPKSQAKQTMQLRWWASDIGVCTLADITPAMIAETRDKLKKRITRTGKLTSNATVVRYLAALSHAFTVAVKEWGWCDDNPVLKVTKPKEPRGRVRYLSDDELERLTAACRASDNPFLYPAYLLALSTGARQAEIMTLTWDDVDLHRGQAILHDTKNDERRSIAIKGRALDVLREHAKVRRIGTDLLFPGRVSGRPIDLRKAWLTALRAAEIKNFHWHDLRHSTASFLAMNGATLAEIAEILGHKTLQMVKRYAHLSEQHSHSVVERMNRKLWGEQ